MITIIFYKVIIVLIYKFFHVFLYITPNASKFYPDVTVVKEITKGTSDDVPFVYYYGGDGRVFGITVNRYPVFGASPPVASYTYALTKNAMPWRFCLRRSRGLRLGTFAFDPAPHHYFQK